ncbi:class A beta-lactamase [Roseococcus sp. SDR]|uniref:class A beta-lactamase n=1 Tax=Roseococcus sp. SDR TaxID=2835532 RepID=UPI001BCFBCB5|nr:class A beta-lactamase [Roseococcus sp. SDR]MBS7790919.1 class A beta-lactamase [Roseococcus sp. SDR]MBV1846233.1 class A beta-lactamase [Roseococcus sp. SDR]
MLARRALPLLAALAPRPAFAEGIAAIEARVGGRLGVMARQGGRVLAHRAGERFPMASTFKALLSAAVLAEAPDMARRLSIPRELVPWSPVTERHAGGSLSLDELCAAIMTISDNTAANLLLGVVGGPAGLTSWLRGIGDGVTRLDRTEPALNEARPGDPRDTTTPEAMVATLTRLALGDVLAPPARARWLGWLEGNTTGGARLRAGVPAGWRVGDRTGGAAHGTSNVVGLLWPPGAAPWVVAAFLTESAAPPAARDAALADVARLLAGIEGPGNW